jgi:hypothetical protein
LWLSFEKMKISKGYTPRLSKNLKQNSMYGKPKSSLESFLSLLRQGNISTLTTDKRKLKSL